MRAWIEDVVVTAAARGRGVGELLNREALRLARELGARTVDLTSRPEREAANRLYAKLGFERRETNVYRHSARLAPPDSQHACSPSSSMSPEGPRSSSSRTCRSLDPRRAGCSRSARSGSTARS